ncbi:hypothetical protein DBR32_15170 [Taibaiella sp. KBW10]|uniref:glycoside hydrolase family 16 protein n=1 Tax=Taibaiella sp. KBW10 TaxID=2153357 RepID=UPI000F59CB4A|nr:family 16 glycosylhydrolase [Taibaiella sp. KBW10]RQO29914.1 hypothetical protein DBR32_15170 [Taibaiella sp. KBW10]
MKKTILKLIPLLTLFLLRNTLWAQLPPVTFSVGANVCDHSSWKLVFYDGFDGSSLNNNNWYRFNSNNWGTTDDWGEGRVPYPGNNTVIQDANVVVNGGTAKLKVIQQPTTWQCATCNMAPYTQNYTSGYLSSKMRFNNGRIEARPKMPIFKGAWSTCWTRFGTSMNEIDFAESASPKGMPGWPYIGKKKPNNAYNLHAWAPLFPNNPYNLHDESIGNSYPNQDWSSWITGSRHKYENWHTYVCEWDTACIKTYLDGALVSTIWKYYQNVLVPYNTGGGQQYYAVKVPSNCAPNAGVPYYVTEGYPYNSQSQSKLIFSTAMTIPEKTLSANGELGQMEIDYVKVYQRHPGEEGHTEICSDPIPAINGPNTMCGTTTYTTTPLNKRGNLEY